MVAVGGRKLGWAGVVVARLKGHVFPLVNVGRSGQWPQVCGQWSLPLLLAMLVYGTKAAPVPHADPLTSQVRTQSLLDHSLPA